MNLYYVGKRSEGDQEAQLEALRKVFTLTSIEEADFMYCASINMLENTLTALEIKKLPLAVYCWDYYLWAHEGKHTNPIWDWKKYAELLKRADVVFAPSTGQAHRLRELFGIEAVVVPSGITTYDHEVTDAGFILDPLREYADDPNRGWAEKAAGELGIPFVHSEHQYSQEEFRKLVASCSFMTSCVWEASTGGLTLMEGLWHGKLSLVSNSRYMGAMDYLEHFGVYFQYDSFEDLKKNMRIMWESRPTAQLTAAKKHILDRYTYDVMSQTIYESLSRNVAASR